MAGTTRPTRSRFLAPGSWLLVYSGEGIWVVGLPRALAPAAAVKDLPEIAVLALCGFQVEQEILHLKLELIEVFRDAEVL